MTSGRASGVIEQYRDRLPVSEATPVVTLGEGGTPLVRSEWLSAETGCEVYLKFEGANPTGSFKDRGMTLAISKALEEGSKAVVCASTGNRGAAGICGQGGPDMRRARAEGQDRPGQDGPNADPWGEGPGDRRQLRRVPPSRAGPGGSVPGHAGELGEPLSPPRSEDLRLRDLRRARPGSRSSLRSRVHS